MSSDNELLRAATDLLARESLFLDERRWDEWIALFCEDCEFWGPSWLDDDTPSRDPNREISMFYCKSRGGLEDRVWRIRSGSAPALVPMPRTAHTVANAVLEPGATGDALTVKSAFTSHVYMVRNKTQHVFFGRYEHGLVRMGGEWRIKRKKITLMNDFIPSLLDVFCV
jgi:3-phenylpropionate/cinnamic acid dioxygenase small subunit